MKVTTPVVFRFVLFVDGLRLVRGIYLHPTRRLLWGMLGINAALSLLEAAVGDVPSARRILVGNLVVVLFWTRTFVTPELLWLPFYVLVAGALAFFRLDGWFPYVVVAAVVQALRHFAVSGSKPIVDGKTKNLSTGGDVS